MAKFANLLRNNTGAIENFAHILLLELIKYINANHGHMYLLDESDQKVKLKLVAAYIYQRRKYLEK